MKKKFLLTLLSILLTACSSDEKYTSGDTQIILYNNGKTMQNCEINPHDKLDIFKCQYEKNENEIVFHLTLNNEEYVEICKIEGKKINCPKLGSFEK